MESSDDNDNNIVFSVDSMAGSSYVTSTLTTGSFTLSPPLYDDGELVITRKDGTRLDVANSLDTLDVKLEVISEVLDEIITETGICNRKTIQERVEQKLMLRRLAGKSIPKK